MKYSKITLILFFVIFIIINSAFGGNEKKKEKQITFGGDSSKTEAEIQKGKTPVGDLLECPVCLEKFNETKFAKLSTCAHRCCFDCFRLYLCIEIFESRVNITCPECSEEMHPRDVKSLLNNPALYDKYEDFLVRRVLAADPDTRYCPAPDCSYAVIATGCSKCPKIKCERPGCDSYFCYYCKAAWNPHHTCDTARPESSKKILRRASKFYNLNLSSKKDIRLCPRCQVLITKNDGCNHMKCTLCGANFCWLCMKEVDGLHFQSQSGCTLAGKIRHRKKILLEHLGILITFPIFLACGGVLVVAYGIPTIVIGIVAAVPVYTVSLIFKLLRNLKRLKRRRANGDVLSANRKFPVDGFLECPLCLKIYEETEFATLSTCDHRFCFKCIRGFLRKEIGESRVNITCPECSEALHPSDIKSLLNNPEFNDKYEDLMVRREVRQEKAAADKNAKGKMKARTVGDDSEAESSSRIRKAVYK